MYLTCDITGLCSGTEYGMAGDKVIVIDNSREMWLVDNNGVKFFVWPNKLSNARIENPIHDQKPLVEKRVVGSKTNPNVNKRSTRSAMPEKRQGSLY